jgi:hypothetical protein
MNPRSALSRRSLGTMRSKPKSETNSLSSKGVTGAACSKVLALTGAVGRSVAMERKLSLMSLAHDFDLGVWASVVLGLDTRVMIRVVARV